MSKLSFRSLLIGMFLWGAAVSARAETPTFPAESPTWMSAALAAGWQPPADWPGQDERVELVGFTAQPAAYSSGSCRVECASSCGSCCGMGSWLDNTQVWFGGEGFKSIGDTTLPPGFVSGYQESFGLVAGFNSGFGIGNSRVRGQVGASYGGYDFKGRDFFETASVEQQI